MAKIFGINEHELADGLARLGPEWNGVNLAPKTKKKPRRRRDTTRYDSVYYPGCSICKAKTGEKHFVGCSYKPPSERAILNHYRRYR